MLYLAGILLLLLCPVTVSLFSCPSPPGERSNNVKVSRKTLTVIDINAIIDTARRGAQRGYGSHEDRGDPQTNRQMEKVRTKNRCNYRREMKSAGVSTNTQTNRESKN